MADSEIGLCGPPDGLGHSGLGDAPSAGFPPPETIQRCLSGFLFGVTVADPSDPFLLPGINALS